MICYHTPMPPRESDPARLRERILAGSVRMPNGCREWRGYRNEKGYGKIKVDGRLQAAHRVAYEAFRAPIPAGLELDHVVCDNPSCIDWWHTEPSTGLANILRGVTSAGAVNARKTRCKYGHPFAGENLYLRTRRNGVTERICLTCQRARGRGWRAPKAPHGGDDRQE